MASKPNSNVGSWTPASAAGISPTPLAQAAFDSVSGTPKSTSRPPVSDVYDKLASLDAKLSTKVTIMELTAQLDAANVKATMFEDKANKIEQETKINAVAVAKRIEALTEDARSASATAAERERIIQFLHQQQATVWHAFLASTNTNAAPPPIQPLPVRTASVSKGELAPPDDVPPDIMLS